MLSIVAVGSVVGRCDLAEIARVDAYAILESGPEARLIAFAPQYISVLEELFWYGQGEHQGLAYLIAQQAPRAAIAATAARWCGGCWPRWWRPR